MKTAVITGITGQDGSYLAELLLAKGYKVIGTSRDSEKALDILSPVVADKIKLVSLDILDKQSILDIISYYRPQEVYNTAAFTSGADTFHNPVAIGEVNGLAVVHILDAIKETDLEIRFCQASSSEVFGAAMESPQREQTIRNPRNPYGAAKLYADSMVKIYRQHYGVFACSAILYNHESPRRGMGFVTRKITSIAVKIKLGLASELYLGNLESLRDWGYAEDYVNGMWLMLQQQSADDYILSTGEMHSVLDFCECAFGYLGLDYRAHVKIDPKSYRPAELLPLVGNSEKAKTVLNWKQSVNFREMIALMIESDMKNFASKKERD